MKRIDKAARKFKFVANSKKAKFRFVPDWVLSEATYFEKEVTEKSENHKVYKRGTLVFVDFGVNVGNELSGHHFAIVLNKKDSIKNGVLTVIPVSSKSNRFSIELDGFISDKSITFLRTSLTHLRAELSISRLPIVKEQLTESEKQELTKTYSPVDKTSYVTHSKYISKEVYDKKIQRIENEIDELKIVVDKYLKFNKVSYAKCLDIRTISKNRIIKINKFDPVGKISVSSDTLDKIDHILKKHFTNL